MVSCGDKGRQSRKATKPPRGTTIGAATAGTVGLFLAPSRENALVDLWRKNLGCKAGVERVHGLMGGQL